MLVPRPDATEMVKVLDFGIAKVSADETQSQSALTQLGSVFGTPAYMSPEQAMGSPVDHRSDLYSLGILLYEMLQGQPPFAGPDTMSVLARQMTATPTPLGAPIPAALAAIVMRLLAKRPEDRIQSAAQLIAVLGGANEQRRRMPRPRGLAELASLLRHPVPIRGVTLPGWVVLGIVGAGAGVLALSLGIGVLRGRRGSPHAIPSAVAAASPLPSLSRLPPVAPDEQERIRKDVERIDALPVYRRSEQDWTALAQGLARLGRHRESVTAYRSLLSIRTSHRRDPRVLADLRRAGEDPEAYRLVVNLCETILGSTGVDLLYELWFATRDDPSRSMIADLAAKKLTRLRRKASSALRITLELEAAQSCETLVVLLPRATSDADARAVRRLESLAVTTGCGANRSEDCYPCLRTTGDLARALERARSRPAPNPYD
jgi:serine/threonine-protein kinase